MSIPPAVMRRVMRELSDLEKNPPEGIRVQTSDEDMFDVTGIIEGPDGTPYAGGYFRVKFKFTEEFPAAPPKCWFATKIFHPNVGANGEICVNTLKKDWKSTYGIGHILITVKCLLIYPNPESALDEEAGKLLLENYSSYCDRAKLITNVHATPRVKPAEFNTPSLPQEDSPVASSSKDSTSTGSSEPLPELSGSPVVSASKVLIPPTATSPSSLSLSTTLSSKTTPMLFTMPVVTRKSASPGPPVSLKASLTSEKEGLNVSGSQKERHPSPSPLGTADANVGNGGKPRMGVGMGMTSAAGVGGTPGNKAIKRSATGSAATGAEKRKKALKRL